MYYREPRSPSSLEQDTIKHITYLAGIAIQRKPSKGHCARPTSRARTMEALAQSLDVLATAPEPEKFIGQMLSTDCSAFERAKRDFVVIRRLNSLTRFAVDVGRRKTGAPDPEHPFTKAPLSWKQNPVIQELLFTAGPVVCDDSESDPRVKGEWGDYLKRKSTKRFLAVPILVGGEVRGFVGVRHADRALLSGGGNRTNPGSCPSSNA